MKSQKKKIKSHHGGSSGTSSSSGSGSSLTSWKNITNRIHEMEDEMRKTSEKQVRELVNSLELNKYCKLRKKTIPKQTKNGTIEEKSDSEEEDVDGTFVYHGTLKNESNEDDEDNDGTFVYHGTVKHSSDSDQGTVRGHQEKPADDRNKSNTGKCLKEDIVAATLLNRNDSPTDEKREISGEDITTLLKMNPKEAAKQIVKGLKKTMSFEEQKVEEKQVNLLFR